jgi:hypothetical protein
MVFRVVTKCSSETAKRFGGTYRLLLQGGRISYKNSKTGGKMSHLLLLISRLAYSPTVKMEVICASETLCFLRTTRRYNPKDHTFHNDRRGNLKFNIVKSQNF